MTILMLNSTLPPHQRNYIKISYLPHFSYFYNNLNSAMFFNSNKYICAKRRFYTKATKNKKKIHSIPFSYKHKGYCVHKSLDVKTISYMHAIQLFIMQKHACIVSWVCSLFSITVWMVAFLSNIKFFFLYMLAITF